MQLTFIHTQVPKIVYTTFLQRVDNSSIVGRGNHIPADIPCQNEIDLLTRASFIHWVVLCTQPFNYLCLNEKTALKEKKPRGLLYSWYLRSRCFIIEKQLFGLSPLQPSFGLSRNAPHPVGEALITIWPLPRIHNPVVKVRTCIVFVDCWCNFIYLFQLLVAMIYKGPIELLIADIEL